MAMTETRPIARWLARVAALPAAQRDALARRLGPHTRHAALSGEGNSTRLVAYVVPRDGADLSPGRLRAYLTERLPAALVPASVTLLDTLPLLPSGKLDRRALPAPLFGRGQLDRPYAPPRTPVEESVCRALSRTLGVPQVGVHDEFWELGGDSLLAVRIMSGLRRELGVELGAQALFEDPTAARLAARVEAARHAADARQAALVPVPRGGPLAPSSAQQRHWFLQGMEPASPAYNICDTLSITGPLDVAALRGALTGIVARHEILRTRYRVLDGRLRQEVLAAAEPPLPVADLSEAAAPDRRRIAAALLEADHRRPFDLEQAPLIRVRLIRFGAEEHLLSVVAHHIAADDWAFNVLYAELSALYAAAREGRPDPLPPLAVQYADYAAWERRLLAERLEEGLAAWREQLLTAPGDPPPPAAAPAGADAGLAHRFEVPAEVAGRLAARCRARSVSVFVACLAAFAMALGEAADREELVIGVPFANRERPELERMIGCFINPAALRVDLGGAPSPDEVLTRVERVVRPAYARQYVPYERVTDAVRRARSAAGRPDAGAALFDVVLNFVSAPTPLRLAGARVERSEDLAPAAPSKNGLTLYLERTGDALRGRVVYQPGRLPGGSAAELAGRFVAALERIASPRPPDADTTPTAPTEPTQPTQPTEPRR